MPDTGPLANPANFASLLTALTGMGKEPAEPWDMSELGEDVATITYEQALKTHRRVRSAEPFAKSTEPNSAGLTATTEAKQVRKTASITIRLTANEQAQLQARAAEAGMSTSAYLRSCIFEAESLRAQVKTALAQMRAAADEPRGSEEKRPALPAQRRFSLFPRWMHRHTAES